MARMGQGKYIFEGNKTYGKGKRDKG